MQRRRFLSSLAGAAALPAISRLSMAAGTRPDLYVSCAVAANGKFVVAGFAAGGQPRFEVPLPARGHGIAFHPTRAECVVFARRPGAFAGILDLSNGTDTNWIKAPATRRFSGHGIYTADGDRLIVAENNFEDGLGVLGIYDTRNRYRRIGEIPSHGVGPHQVRLMRDGKTIAVANGGILTHPLHGRDKLNIQTMAPNLSQVDALSGALRHSWSLPPHLHKLSIRHIDIDRQDRIAIAMQYEGDPHDDVALVAIADRHNGIRLLRAPKTLEAKMQRYTGAIAFDSSGTYVAASGSRCGITIIWNAVTGDFQRHFDTPDTSGIAATGKRSEFLLSGGDGAIHRADGQSGRFETLSPPSNAHRWDNHMETTVSL